METSGTQTADAEFDQRVVALYPQLFRLAVSLCRNSADAHDLAQDAVERGLKSRRSFRSGDAPDRWMSTILRRIFVDRCRLRRRRVHVPLTAATDAAAAPEPDAPQAWEAFSAEDVEGALLLVDRESRELFRLFVFHGLPQDEIARRLAIARKTVATRVFRTRAKLRQLLESGAFRRSLALVPGCATPTTGAAGHVSAGGRVPQHPPRLRTASRRRARRVNAARNA